MTDINLEYDKNGNLLVDALYASNKLSSTVAKIDGRLFAIRMGATDVSKCAPTAKNLFEIKEIESEPTECGEITYLSMRCRPRKGFRNNKLNEALKGGSS